MTRNVWLLTCAVTQLAIAQAPQLSREELAAVKVTFTTERDAAVVYVREQSFFITRMAQRCRKELHMPPSPTGEPESASWISANYRYTAAAARYRDKKTGMSDPLAGYQTALKEMGQVQEKAYADADAKLKATRDRAQICRAFFADSESGKLNVDKTNSHYETLEGLARELFDPLPRR